MSSVTAGSENRVPLHVQHPQHPPTGHGHSHHQVEDMSTPNLLPHAQQHHAQQNHAQQNHSQQNHPQQNHPQQNHPQQNHPQQNHDQQNHPQQNHDQQNHGVQYRLLIRQQPEAARQCGFGERDRRTVDPPPIVQLLVEGPNLTMDEIKTHLRYPYYVVTCDVKDESGSLDIPKVGRYPQLVGRDASGPFVGKDEFGIEGCFFTFPDLSCRATGSYCLEFSLIKLYIPRPGETKRYPILATVKSNVFNVCTAKEFPGMQCSSKLVKALKAQGCIITLKKGNEGRSVGKRAKKDSSYGEDSSDDQDSSDGEYSTQQHKRRRR
ncbi:hypothetical protein IL306_007786 [Fusarium sp. DS 682]|nr:hypothetical protein IL306_007786 [Fusarium sp. DS 682]